MGPLTSKIMIRALQLLSDALSRGKFPKVTLIMGGGGAMVLAHHFPLGTTDIDAIPKGISIEELDPLVKLIAEQEKLPFDWLNPYFSTFSHTLPPDYGTRLIQVLETPSLEVLALGREEMLIMKCFAHRRKDVGHARALVRSGADLEQVEARIEELRKKGIRDSAEALDFLQEILELEGQ
ncbi:MAG: hypothetical protein H7222_08110 [Methylotenera sp.]|nr:hypothetical protein [Oligoflexia bacterium]